MKHGYIEKLITTDYTLYVLETTSPDKIVNSFRYFSRNGRATYVWEDSLGLSRLEASHITLPNTNTPLEVLNHIHTSRHFGIYLLKGFNKFMQNDELHRIMQQLSEEKSVNKSGHADKTVIFLDRAFKLPVKLLKHLLIAQEPLAEEKEPSAE